MLDTTKSQRIWCWYDTNWPEINFLTWNINNTRILNEALTPKQIEELYYSEKWNFIN